MRDLEKSEYTKWDGEMEGGRIFIEPTYYSTSKNK
jgi:hypothetical protein